MLNLIDEFTHECLAIRVDRKLNSADVIVLSDQFALRGVPEHIRSDNGPEFVASGAAPGRTAISRASMPAFAMELLRRLVPEIQGESTVGVVLQGLVALCSKGVAVQVVCVEKVLPVVHR